jgi:virginiamycin B lyase
MVGQRRTTIAALGLASILAACSGSTGSPLPGAPSSGGGAGGAAPNAQSVTLQMVIQGSHRARAAHSPRAPKFVSPATDGLLAQIYPHGTSHTTPIVQAAFDVSSGSKACTAGTPRTCSVIVGVPPAASDDFVVTSYDAAPSGSGSFAGAHVLGVGSLSGQQIVVGTSNPLTIYLDGVIAGLSGQAAFVSLPADGSAHALSFVIDAADYGNKPITAGHDDPYANPIVVSMAESGGSGHALLSLNGFTGRTSVTLKYSTDTVALKYDGNGSPGYGVAVSISAPQTGGTGGASEAVQVSPLFVTSTSAYFTAATRTLSLSSSLAASMSLTELKATGASTYSATPSACTNVASAGAASGTRASATVGVTGGSTASSSGCTIAFSDGTSTVTVSAINTTGGGGVGVPPAVTIAEYPVKPTGIAFPYGIAAGSDGAMWFTECQSGANKIGRIPTNASSPNPTNTATPTPQITEFPLPTSGANPAGITSGPDGALWFTESANAVRQIGRIPTNATPGSSAQITEYTTNVYAPGYGIATGSDGNLWFGAKAGANAVLSMTQTGQVLNTYTTTWDSPTNFVTGPDGAMWFTECANPGHIGRIAAGQLTEAAIPTTLGVPQPVGIAVGSDGNIWFTDQANKAIGKAVVTGTGIGTITEIATPGIGTPNGIVSGPDGALWFTQTVSDSAIGRIPTNALTTADIMLYETPTANAHPLSITRGPDGNLWFTEQFCECVGRLAIGSAPSAERAKKKHAHVRPSR